MKVNFREFKMYVDIEQVKTHICDIRKEFADIIYRSMNGIVAHDLALRIYRSEGKLEITNEEEIGIIKRVVSNSTPMFIDSFEANIIE